MISSVLRIMTSGILAGTLIKTGAAEKIAEVIVQKLGEKRALIAVAAATMVICAVGVFCGYFSYYSSTYCTGDWKKSRI